MIKPEFSCQRVAKYYSDLTFVLFIQEIQIQHRNNYFSKSYAHLLEAAVEL